MFGKGMEMMIVNVIKSIGIDPIMLQTKFDELTTLAKNHLQSFDNSLKSVDDRLARIEKALGIEEQVKEVEHDDGE